METRDTLHMWTQIVGKVRPAHAPPVNHWWRVTLYVGPRGRTTSAIPYGAGSFDVEFDFLEHRLVMRRSDGRVHGFELGPMPVAEFHARTMRALDELGIDTDIQSHPNEVEPAIPFRDRPRTRLIRSRDGSPVLAATASGRAGNG